MTEKVYQLKKKGNLFPSSNGIYLFLIFHSKRDENTVGMSSGQLKKDNKKNH